MTLLPVAHRELLVDARNGGGAWARFLSGLGGVGLFGLLWVTPMQSQPQVVSSVVFHTLAWLSFAYACLSGALHTSDAVGREKRSGTLGLLFLTDLTAIDVILGKLCATGARSVYGVLALVPVLSLPVMVGGVSGGQVFRAVVAILVTLFLSLSLGLLASVVARDFRGAVTATVLAMSGLSAGLDGVGWAVALRTGTSPDAARQWSPMAMMRWSQAEPWRSPAIHASFGRAWKRQALLGAGALAVAAACVRRRRSDWTEPAREIPKASDASGLVGWRHVEWEALLARSPYAWLQRVARPVPWTFKVTFGLMAGLFVVAALASISRPGTNAQLGAAGAAMLVLAALHVGLKLQVALAATRGIGEDRESGGLEMLVVSGIGPELVQEGHRDALVRQYRGPLMTVYACQFGMAAVLSARGMPPDVGALLLALVVGAAFLWIDFDTLLRVGLRHGLKERGPQAAFRATVVRVLLPGWIAVLPLGVSIVTGGSATAVTVLALSWLAFSAYVLKKVRKRARIDVEHGFMQLAAELPFDTDDWEVRDDFRRAAGAQYPSARAG